MRLPHVSNVEKLQLLFIINEKKGHKKKNKLQKMYYEHDSQKKKVLRWMGFHGGLFY